MTNLSFPLSGLLAAAAVGFILGVFYHTAYWSKIFRLDFIPTVTHLPLIRACFERGWLVLRNREDGSMVDIAEVAKPGAWRIVTAFWHERKESSDRIKSANMRTDSFTDIMHGLGAALIGSVLAVPFWIFTNWKLSDGFPAPHFYLIPWFVVFVHLVNFRRVIKDFQSIVDIIMSNELQELYSKKCRPIVINIGQTDLISKSRFACFKIIAKGIKGITKALRRTGWISRFCGNKGDVRE